MGLPTQKLHLSVSSSRVAYIQALDQVHSLKLYHSLTFSITLFADSDDHISGVSTSNHSLSVELGVSLVSVVIVSR